MKTTTAKSAKTTTRRKDSERFTFEEYLKRYPQAEDPREKTVDAIDPKAFGTTLAQRSLRKLTEALAK